MTLLFLSANTQARSRARAVPPLMPPAAKWEGLAGIGDPRPRHLGTDQTEESDGSDDKTPRRSWMVGLEAAGMANSSEGSGDLAGLSVLWGGRFAVRIPMVGYQWFLKSSAGFFYRHSGTAGVGVSQYVAEAGLVPQYVINPRDRLRGSVGLANRLDLLWSRINALSATSSSSLDWRYRVGPSVGFIVSASRTIQVTSDFEFTWAVRGVGKGFGALSVGLMFRLD